jgi:hypothetical protein
MLILFYQLILTSDANRPRNLKLKDTRTPLGGRNKFDDPVSPIYPPAILAWHQAAAEFNTATAKFVWELLPTDLGYIFPEPAGFVSVTPERQEAMFRGWLKYRKVMIYRVSASNFSTQPMPQGLWRDFLTLEHVQNLKRTSANGVADTQHGGPSHKQKADNKNRSSFSGSAARSSENTRSGKHRELAADFLRGCLNAAEGVELVDSNGDLKWNGEVLETLDYLIREEILWELAELNFRFELLALDARRTGRPPSPDRQQLITSCFPGGKGGVGSLLVADLGAANHGLASDNWEEKALYLMALKKIMATWQGTPPPIIQVTKYAWSRREIEDLEVAIATFYVQTFYSNFRRAPVVPRGLSHQVSPYCAPPPPKITVLDPLPNMFYDVSALSLVSAAP